MPSDTKKIYDFGSEYAPAVVVVGADGQPVGGNNPTPSTQTITVRTPLLSRPTTDGEISAGAGSVSVANTSSVICTVAGAQLRFGETISWQTNGNDALGAILYIIPPGGELLISEVR